MNFSFRYCLTATLFLVACGAGDGTSPDAGGRLDAGDPHLDAHVPDAEQPDSEAPNECTPGERRSVSCERCGLAQETCDADGAWTRSSECLAQGLCEEGDIERETLPLCGERSRLCTTSCEWTDWQLTVPSSGSCEPGTSRNTDASVTCEPGLVAVDRCDESCAWSPVCVSPCSLVREEPWDAVEVCIPEGTFVRGHPSFIYHTPQVETFMSAFLIDRFPVTNRRYAECVDAGACAAPIRFPRFRDSDQRRRPVMLATRDNAVDFCNWDGGRLAVSQAEWEKAAKGPAPRDPSFPWGEVAIGCADFPFEGCPDFDGRAPSDGLPYDVDAFPEWDSIFGVSMLVTVGDTVTREPVDNEFHSRSRGSSDPSNEWDGTRAATRGPRPFTIPNPQNMSVSYAATGGTIRCVRRFN